MVPVLPQSATERDLLRGRGFQVWSRSVENGSDVTEVSILRPRPRRAPMANRRTNRQRPVLERLELRMALSGLPLASGISTAMTGRDQSTGSYAATTTRVGDVNGDGKVDLADLQAFAPTYMSRVGSPAYNPAADSNHDGIIDSYDA